MCADMKDKDPCECYLKAHLLPCYPELPQVLESSSRGAGCGRTVSMPRPSRPQLCSGVPERNGCTKENESRNKKEELQNLNKKRKRAEAMICLPYPMRQACRND